MYAPPGHGTSPDWKTQTFPPKVPDGDGTHTCPEEHPPPTLVTWHARAVSVQPHAGTVLFVVVAAHDPFSAVAPPTFAESAPEHPEPTQNPIVV